MSDRLKDLQRQRSLAQEQLAWLDREIARETGPVPIRESPSPVGPVGAQETPQSADVSRTADEILAQYRRDPASTTGDVKRGCYLYFVFALVGLIVCVVTIYMFYTRR